MAELRFKVKADYEELGKLRTEIQKLKADLKSTGRNTDSDAVKAMESQLAMLTKQYEAMTKRIAEAEAQYDALAKKMTERARDIARAQDTISEAAVNPPTQTGTAAPVVDTSLETQAKAYEELKKEIDAIAGSKTNLIKQMLDEQNAIRLINAELKQINAEQKTNGKQTQAQKERVTQLNDSLLTHKQALSEVRQSLSNYVKLENAASGSMNELSQSLGRMRMVYRDLSEEERNSPFGNELLASIQQADAKIKELDATIGNHQRNVGNYGQAWNGLGNSIQQLARELPALANGPRVFFSAISNNLPILADEIKRARTEYDEMVKKGEKGVPVWKQIGASILSWQTALTVGITLLTMYGDKIVEWGKKILQGSKALNDTESAAKKLNKTMSEGAKDAANEVVALRLWDKMAKDVARTDEERNIAAKKVLDTIGQQITTTNIAKAKNGEFTQAIQETTAALIEQAKAQAAMKIIQEEYSKVMDAQAKVAERRARDITAGDRKAAELYNQQYAAVEGKTVTAEELFQRGLDVLEAEVQKATEAYEKFENALLGKVDPANLASENAAEGSAEVENYVRSVQEEINRITQMEKDAMRDRARAVKDMQFSVEQARIDAMAQGYVRSKEQRELNEKKEIEDLRRQKEDYIRQVVEQEKAIFDAREEQKAQADKKYVKQTFDTEAATAEVSKTDPVVAQYASAIAYTRRQYAKEAAREEKEWQNQRARQAREMETMVSEARIDAMKDGYAKERAQRIYEHKREIETLERQKQEYIDKMVEQERTAFEAQEDERAKNIRGYQRQEFDAEIVRINVDTSAFDEAMSYANESYARMETEAVNNLYDQYKSYEDSKKDLEKSYLEDILELNNEYIATGDEKYLRSIQERHKAYIKALNELEAAFGTDEYKLIFGDPERMTRETIDRALSVARKRMAQLDEEADPETFRALSEAIARLEDARDSNPFQGWDTSVMGVAQKLHQIRNIRKDIADYEKQGNAEAKEASEAELQKAKKDLTKALIGTGVAQFGDALTTAAASMKEVAKASGDIDLERQAEALEKAGGFISSVASGAASGGWVGAIIGGATSLMDMLVSSITKSKVVAAEAKKAYEDYLDELARTARTINEEDYETIFGLRTLDKVIDASEAAKKSWEAYQEVMDRVNGDRRKPDSSKGLENMLNSEGKKLRDAYSEIFTWEKGPRGQYQVSGLDLEEALKLLEAFEGTEQASANWYKALEEAVNALQDYKDNVRIVDDYLASLFSNVGGEIADAIMQGNDALEVLEDNAGQIFKSIAKDMIMSTLIGPEFIEKYKKMLREAMATGRAEDDAAVLSQFADELGGNIEAAAAQWEELKRIAEEKGIDMFGAEAASQQEASSKGYQTLSEDTGNELVGRALAQYESNLRMEEAMMLTKESIDLMAANQVQIRDIAVESRQIMADSYLELQQIKENTGAVIKPITEMGKKIAEWDTYIKRL